MEYYQNDLDAKLFDSFDGNISIGTSIRIFDQLIYQILLFVFYRIPKGFMGRILKFVDLCVFPLKFEYLNL